MSDEPENKGGNKPSKLPAAFIAAQFKPGQTGNPKGRPRGLAARLRDLELSWETDKGKSLGEVLLNIAHDETAKGADRIAATKLLWERAHGRTPEAADEENPTAVRVITDAHIQTFLEALTGRSAPTPRAIGSSSALQADGLASGFNGLDGPSPISIPNQADSEPSDEL